ncbi:T9SS type A sorting domain-containing protein [Flavobacterium sp.]|uniref:T9SS type A sorting domain-containing protein n=1 Tax=Flavobacterium sp. TaxID=239 RepID=UPI003D295B3E
MSIGAQSQDRIKFDYDTAGNQIVRKLCLGCLESKTSEEEIKAVTDLKEEDLLKFSSNDVISYYPNPVKEELYLKWELINENKVSKIEIYSINGQLVKSIKSLENENSSVIPFQEYPVGTYSILLFYTNNEQKSITIIKN